MMKTADGNWLMLAPGSGFDNADTGASAGPGVEYPPSGDTAHIGGYACRNAGVITGGSVAPRWCRIAPNRS